MYSLYPGFKKLKTLLIFLLIAGSVHAQQTELAKRSSNRSLIISSGDVRINTVVRIASRTERQVVLTWSPVKGGISHYILERSVNGRNYEEAGVFFTGEGIDEPDYVYTDKLSRPYTGTLFYRLRVVGLNGYEAYTYPGISELISENTITKNK